MKTMFLVVYTLMQCDAIMSGVKIKSVLPVEDINPEFTTMIKFWHVNMNQLIKIHDVSKSEKDDDKRNNDW